MFFSKKKVKQGIRHETIELFIKRLKKAEQVSDEEMTFELTMILRACDVHLEPYSYTNLGFPMRFCPPPPKGATPEEIKTRLMLGIY